MPESVNTSIDHRAFSTTSAAVKILFATLISLVLLVSTVVLLIAITLRVTAIHSLPQWALAGTADVALGTFALLGAIRVTTGLFVRFLGGGTNF
jgi:hypothetical protein